MCGRWGHIVLNGGITASCNFTTNIIDIFNKIYLLDWMTIEDGTDRLSRNVCKQLPTYAA
jgi:hypothetical protein